jgi:molybdopterin converting factor small subunit
MTNDLSAPATVGDAWRALVAAHPAAVVMSTAVSCAKNAEFSSMDAPVTDGDEVAFLPPVSGGAEECDDAPGS